MTLRYPDISRSNAIHSRCEALIPAGTQTLAKGTTQWVEGVAPKYLQRGRGARVWDVDGNEFIDLAMAIGPVSLGYAHPVINRAIVDQLNDGITFTLPHALEVEVAELVTSVVPGAEMVRFSKTGADVTSAAVRLARAYTGRPRVLCCGYHGWHDWYISVTDRSAGVPEAVASLTHTFAYNDLSTVEAALDSETACVILEPTTFEPPAPGFLQELRRMCDDAGALLVFDEMWTGFRLALGGAQERFDVRADLACFSKAVANGMPLSILTGRREVMRLCDREVFFFTTFGGEALSLAAAKATMGIMRDEPVFQHLARQGRALMDGFNSIAQSLGMPYARAVGHAERSLVQLEAPAGSDVDPLICKSYLQQELIACGVLWNGCHNMSYAHGDAEVGAVLEAYRRTLPLLRDALERGDIRERLRGRPLEPAFRRTHKFHTKHVR